MGRETDGGRKNSTVPAILAPGAITTPGPGTRKIVSIFAQPCVSATLVPEVVIVTRPRAGIVPEMKVPVPKLV